MKGGSKALRHPVHHLKSSLREKIQVAGFQSVPGTHKLVNIKVKVTPISKLCPFYFILLQITARVFSPGVAGNLLCPDAGISIAYLLIMTFTAPAFKRSGALFQTGHQRVGGILPDFREGPVPDIAKMVMPPEGIGMHVAQVVDVGNIYT